jgi:hypothetical protein
MVEPRWGPWSRGEAVPETATDRAPTCAAEARTGAGVLSAAGNGWGWFAAYLGQYPEGVAVPRQALRDMADKKWIDEENGPVPISRAKRLRRLMEGRSGNATEGRRSSKKLAAHLKTLEELGLVRRDNTRDAIIITDPDGLRRLGDAQCRVHLG